MEDAGLRHNTSAISREFLTTESFTCRFLFDIQLKEFSINCKNTATYIETFEELEVGSDDVVFDVTVTATPSNVLDVKLHRRSQRLSDVKVTNCIAVVKEGDVELCKSISFVARTLVPLVEQPATSSTVVLRSIWKDSRDFVTKMRLPYYDFQHHQAVLKITGLIIYNNPVQWPTLQNDLHGAMNKNGDVEIVIGDTKFSAHKWLLSARCEFFRNMFQSNMKESQENLVKLPEEDPHVFEQVLLFIYTDTCSDLNLMATDLLFSADKFNLVGLRVLCEEELMKTMNVDNVCDYLVKSKSANSTRIYEKCIDFFSANISDIVQTEGWREMKKVDHAEMLMADIFERMGKKET